MSWMQRVLAAIGLGSHEPLGRRGEQLAAKTLRRQGYSILGRNVRLRIGEADLVCLAPDRRTVVIVEVKTRLRGQSVSELGNTVAPEASVNQRKRRKLQHIAAALVKANNWNDRPVRIDVVAIEWPDSGGKPEVRHHAGAVVGA